MSMYKIIFLLFFASTLVSCGQSQSDIDAAKKKILNPEPIIEESLEESLEEGLPDTERVESTPETEDVRPVSITPLDANSPLDFDRIDESRLASGEVAITGKNI